MNTYVRALSRELGKRGLEVDVFTRAVSKSGNSVEFIDEHSRLIPLKAGPLAPLPKSEVIEHLPEFIAEMEAFRCASQLQYDLIHSHYWLSALVGQHLRNVWAIPHITMFHTTAVAKNGAFPDDQDSPQRPNQERYILHAADAVIVSSNHEKAIMSRLCEDRDQRIITIPCGVDTDHFRLMDKRTAKTNLGLNGKQVVLFVGRLVPLKGLDTLIEAIAMLSGIPNLQTLIVGGQEGIDPEAQRLQRMVDELHLSTRVQFAGPVAHEQLPLHYNAADICVVPSHYESFCLVATEALACGTPVVASRVGGLTDNIKDGLNGYLVSDHCPQAFAERIATTLRQTADNYFTPQSVRASIHHLTWQEVAERVLDVYEAQLQMATDARRAHATASPFSHRLLCSRTSCT